MFNSHSKYTKFERSLQIEVLHFINFKIQILKEVAYTAEKLIKLMPDESVLIFKTS